MQAFPVVVVLCLRAKIFRSEQLPNFALAFPAGPVLPVKIQEVQSGVQIGQTLAAAAPSPWGPIISSLIGLAGVELTPDMTIEPFLTAS